VVESPLDAIDMISDLLKGITDAEDLPNHYNAVKRRLVKEGLE
jgi:hypothetical protein